MRVLRSRLFERQQEKVHRERSDARKSLIGSGDRNSRIRTYNYPQNRCTDHRIEFTAYKLDAIMQGELNQMIIPMKEAVRKERLAAQ
jgi:peptide chain release factor 1